MSSTSNKRKAALDEMHADLTVMSAKAPNPELKVVIICLIRLVEIERDGEPHTAMPKRHHQ